MTEKSRDEIAADLQATLERFAGGNADKRFVEKALREALAKIEPRSSVDEILAEASFLRIGVGSAKHLESLLKSADDEQIEFIWTNFGTAVTMLELEVNRRANRLLDWTVDEETDGDGYQKTVRVNVMPHRPVLWIDKINLNLQTPAPTAKGQKLIPCPECSDEPNSTCARCKGRGRVLEDF